MDFPATQAYVDEDTQKFSDCIDEEKLIQIRTLSINSIKYQIKKGITKIGRLDTCDIVINDETVSKIHAEIDASIDGEAAFICDLDSSNKTKLNNIILRPSRLYELKDESIIKFGKVSAFYKIFHPSNDILMPETPVPKRQQITESVIPDTPDSSFNKSCSTDSDASIIVGTPRDKESSIFRRPVVSQLLKHTNVDNKDTALTSINDIENQETSILNTEKQEFSTNISENVKPTIGVKRLPKINTVDKTTRISMTDIHDIEAKNHEIQINIGSASNKQSTDKTYDIETQDYIDLIHEMATQKLENDETKIQVKDTPNINTQIKLNEVTNADYNKQDDNDENKDNVSNINNSKTSNKSFKQSFNSSRSSIFESNPGSLNSSSSAISEGCSSSPFNQSAHLFESSDLLRYFRDDIDKQTKVQISNTSILKPRDILKSQNYVKISDNDKDNIFDTPTQQDKQCKVLEKELKLLKEANNSETDTEKYLAQLPKKRKSLRSLNKLYLENFDNVNDPSTSIESEDMFDVSTQSTKNYESKNTSNLSTKQLQNIDKTNKDNITSEQIINNIKSTHECDNMNTTDNNKLTLLQLNKVSSKAATDSKVVSLKSSHGIDDINTDMSKSVNCVHHTLDLDSVSRQEDEFIEYSDQENRDYEMAPTQLIGEIESEGKEKNTKIKDSNGGKVISSSKKKLNDTLEQDLNKIFDNTNNENVYESSQLSTQCLKNILESSQANDNASQTSLKKGHTSRTSRKVTNVVSDEIDVNKTENDPSSQEDEFTEYSDQENLDYEMAPTQLIGEIESEGKEKNTKIKDPNCGKVISSSKKKLNETLEQDLNKMFDDANNENVYESSQLSTQCLKNILESSQCNDNAPQTSLKKGHTSRTSRKVTNVSDEIDANKTENNLSEFTEYSDQENLDYEMAPTQLIGEIESEGKEKNTKIKDSNCGKVISSSKKKLNDTLDNTNNENVYELSQLSTQCLKTILLLESSQCKDNAPQTSSKEEGHTSRTSSSRKVPNIVSDEIDVNKMENDPSSQEDEFIEYSDQENLDYEMAPTQLIGEIESEEKEKNTKIKDSNCGKAISSSKEKLNETLEQNLNNMFDNVNNENVYESSQLSTQGLKNILESSQCNDNAPQTRPLSLRKVSNVVSNRIDINKTENDRSAQILEISFEDDDDILARFPAVNILGTLSNPSSSSLASTSSMCNIKSKQNTVTRSNKKKSILNNKLWLRRNNKQSVEEKNQIKSSLRDNCSSVVNINSSIANRISNITTTSEDSNNEISYKHMTDKMSNTELSNMKKRKGNTQIASQCKKRNTRSLTNMLKKVKEDIVKPNTLQTNTRSLRSSNKQNKESLCASHIAKEIQMENVNDKFTDQKTKASTINKKRSFDLDRNLIEEDMEHYSKKYKVNPVTETRPITMKQSPNISKYSRKNSLRKNSSVTGHMKCAAEEKIPKIVLRKINETFSNSKIDTNNKYKEDNVKTIKYEIDNRNNQVIIYDDNIVAEGNSNRNKKTQIKRKKTKSRQTQDNITQVLSNFGVGQESQEVEMIMEKVLDNVHDKYLTIRQNSNVKTLQRELRTRSKRHSNINKQIKSDSIENTLSNIDNVDNIKSDSTTLKTTNKRSIKSSLRSLTIPLTKEEIFENRTSIKQQGTHTLFDSSIENPDTKDNKQNTNLSYPKSKVITQNKKEVNKPINNNTVLGTERTSFTSMASRTRRSVSLLSNSLPSSMKHRVIFTGITEEKFDKIVKTLGGYKVEHPEKCTILVTDKVRRTYKFLCALAKGVPIVTINWLEDSESAGQFLNWEAYILKDPAAEAKFGFKLRKSLNKTKEKRLLENYTVLLTPNIVQPPIKELKDMITCCGGKTSLRPPTKWPENVVIISCNEDLSTAKKFLTKAPKTITIQSTEFILTGILRQEMDFVKYKLM